MSRSARAQVRGVDYANPSTEKASFDDLMPFQRADKVAIAKQDLDAWTKIMRKLRRQQLARESKIREVKRELKAIRIREQETERRR
jgi:hypothetical protein